MSNLVELWLEVETAIPGRTIADALRDLTEHTGRVVKHSQLSRWRHGEYAPHSTIQRHMREVVMEAAIARALGEPPGTYTDEQIDALVTLLSK